MILENNTVMGNLVYRGYEEEFANGVNGYEKGDTISIRRPTDFTVRSGAVAAIQEVVVVDPPASQRDGPIFLNILRALDVPEALGLLAPKKLTLINARDKAFERTSWRRIGGGGFV